MPFHWNLYQRMRAEIWILQVQLQILFNREFLRKFKSNMENNWILNNMEIGLHWSEVSISIHKTKQLNISECLKKNFRASDVVHENWILNNEWWIFHLTEKCYYLLFESIANGSKPKSNTRSINVCSWQTKITNWNVDPSSILNIQVSVWSLVYTNQQQQKREDGEIQEYNPDIRVCVCNWLTGERLKNWFWISSESYHWIEGGEPNTNTNEFYYFLLISSRGQYVFPVAYEMVAHNERKIDWNNILIDEMNGHLSF